MQCLSFCLFGVYGVDDEKRIQVQNQDNCKTNCPACSRVCPEAAIMFPKYKAGPINGDVVSADRTPGTAGGWSAGPQLVAHLEADQPGCNFGCIDIATGRDGTQLGVWQQAGESGRASCRERV